MTTARIDKELRPIVDAAVDQGFRVESTTTGLVWYAPAGNAPDAPLPKPIHSSRRVPRGREWDNLLAALHRAGFRDHTRPHGGGNGATAAAELEPAPERVPWVADLAGGLAALIEQEYDRRVANLTARLQEVEDERTALGTELAEARAETRAVRTRLEDAESGIEERVMEAARLAAEQVLAARRKG